MSQMELTQEKWNIVLDIQEQLEKQQDELDRLRRVSRALLAKNEELEIKLMKRPTNDTIYDIFGLK